MAMNDLNLQAVLDAARLLLAAREDGMLTSAEWEALREAVDGCERPATGDGIADDRSA